MQYDDDHGENSGSAYVFHFDGSEWVQQAKLLPADGETSDKFGVSVDIDGNMIIVGAEEDDDTAVNAGSAYVFQFDGMN
jgi:N-acetylneuraminic acid mutarotase